MGERLYTQGDLDEKLNEAHDDGVLFGTAEVPEAWREGFRSGYAAAVDDIATGEPKGAQALLRSA